MWPQAIAAINGLAGLHILEDRLSEAVQLYRTALQLAAGNAALIRSDPLQRLHTLHNLAQLLGRDGRGVPGVVPTLRDASLKVGAALERFLCILFDLFCMSFVCLSYNTCRSQDDADAIRDDYVAKFTARMAATAADLETLRQDMQAKLQDGDVNENGVWTATYMHDQYTKLAAPVVY